MNRSVQIKSTTAYKFILPGFLVYCFALIVPIFVAVYISFLDWRGTPKFVFVGLDNYINLFQDQYFWNSFLNNLKFIGILLVTQIGLAFVVALFYQSKYIKLKEFHRRVIYAPAVLGALVVGMIWSLVYRTDIGIFATIMKNLGLEDFIIPWLDSPNLVIPAICLTLTWQFVGQFSIILTAGMQNISKDLIEAAEIDGANAVQRATKIVFPLLTPTVAVCATMCISGCMKLFDIVLSMSGGGPGRSSMVTALYTYQLAFQSQKFGYASAAALCMLVLSLILVMGSRKILLGGEKDGK